jgi:hypothetical protein
MSEGVGFNIVAVQTGPSTYRYTMEVTDTGDTQIGTFWFSWIPGAGYLSDNPTFTSPTGWAAMRTNGPPPADGYSIQWVAQPGDALNPGQTLAGFTFNSQEAPATLFGQSQIHPSTPVTESTFYTGAPFSDAGTITAATSMQQQVLQFGVLSETDIFTIVEAQPYDLYSYDYSPGGAFIGSRFFYSSGEEVDYDGAGRLTRAEFTAATSAPYSSYEYDYVGGAFAGSKFDYTSVPSGASYSSYEVDYNQANALEGEKFFWTDVTGQSYTGEEEDFDASGARSSVLLRARPGS